MIFSHHQEFEDSEVELVKNVLEKLLGRERNFCRNYAEENDFIFLDQWDNKMGFVKESKNKYLILSLQFEESKCNYYQVIIKAANDKWTNGKIIDNDVVRKTGIIQDD